MLGFWVPSLAQFYTSEPGFLNANKVWAFGFNAGLDLRSGAPVPFESAHTGIEGGAAAADPVTGRFLFYSNGLTCWNASHQPMPNGSNLMGNGTGNCAFPCLSTRQGVCIVPVVGSPKQYYLFSLMGITNAPTSYAAGSLFYSVVDMRLDNGKGDIVPGKKNLVLSSDSLSECMIAIPGNNCDIWLLTHEMERHRFRAYHITAAGIDPNPVISTVVSSIAGKESFTISELSVSPDRSKIVLTSQTVDNTLPRTASGVLIAQFDPNTGIVSNGFNLMHTNQYQNFYPGSASFSPNGSILYVSAASNLTQQKYTIYQFDVSNYDSATIVSSVLPLDTLRRGTPVVFKLYNDKVYVSEFDQALSPLHCINQPNVRGKGYNLDTGIVHFLPGTFATLTLGNHVLQSPASETISEYKHDVFLCQGGSLTLTPGRIFPGGKYLWDDNSQSPTRTVTKPGSYQVAYSENGCDATKEIFTVHETSVQPMISVEGFTLSTVAIYKEYQWILNGNAIPGATNRIWRVVENGTYQVSVRDDNDCEGASEPYLVKNVSVAEASPEPDVSVYPNPAHDFLYFNGSTRIRVELTATDGRIMGRSEGAMPVSIGHLPQGIYFVCVRDEAGNLLTVQKVIKQ
jgi:hypothetical protein